MKKNITRFFEVAKKKGYISATKISINWFIGLLYYGVYELAGLRYFIRHQLGVGSGRIFDAVYVGLYAPLLEKRIGSGVDVMEKDWDNLILLDAYRADYFKKYSSIQGDLLTIVSQGNGSYEFVDENFAGKEFHDTVVITSNVWYQKHPDVDGSTFYKLVNPVGTEERTKTNPQLVTEAATKATKKFPNKRIIVHYMSPHTPHMGETANRARERFRGKRQYA